MLQFSMSAFRLERGRALRHPLWTSQHHRHPRPPSPRFCDSCWKAHTRGWSRGLVSGAKIEALVSCRAVTRVLLSLASALPAPTSGAADAQEALKRLEAGQAALERRDWPAAQAEFTSALLLEPLLPAAYYGLGQAQTGQGHHAAASESFLNCKRALEELNTLAQGAANRAELKRVERIQELNDYIVFLRAREKTFGSQGDGSEFAAITSAEQGITRLQSARGRRPKPREIPVELSFALGTAHLRAGRLAEAEAALLEAVAKRPQFGPAHNNLAVVYVRTGRVKEARSAVEKAELCGFKVQERLKLLAESTESKAP